MNVPETGSTNIVSESISRYQKWMVILRTLLLRLRTFWSRNRPFRLFVFMSALLCREDFFFDAAAKKNLTSENESMGSCSLRPYLFLLISYPWSNGRLRVHISPSYWNEIEKKRLNRSMFSLSFVRSMFSSCLLVTRELYCSSLGQTFCRWFFRQQRAKKCSCAHRHQFIPQHTQHPLIHFN